MPTPTKQLLSRTTYDTDGVTTVWEFAFSGGYLDVSHVKAYTVTPEGLLTIIPVTPTMVTGTYQLQIVPALAAGATLTIYRDTPKDLPLVDFTDESSFSELALDTNAKQAVFIAAETIDTVEDSPNFDAVVSVATALAAAEAAALAATTAPVAAPTTAAPDKANPDNPDYLPLVEDSTGLLKKLTWANLKSTVADASLGGYLPAGTGAVATTVQGKLRESVSVADFGAAVGNTATQNVTAFQAALDYANGIGGCKVLVPKGTYLLNAALNIYKKTILQGDGRQSSILSFSHTGDGIKSTWPINSNTGVWIGIRDLAVISSNGSNTGGGFVDVGGSFVEVFNCYFSGFKFGVIFDQSEIASVEMSQFEIPANGSGVWLVNGADHTVGGSLNYTNRITITRSQFNSNASGVANILDDGGGNHSIRDNNFNAGNYGVKAAGVFALVISGNESEVHGTADIYLLDTTAAGAYVGPCSAFDISGNELISTYGYNIGIQHAVNGKITANLFAQAAAGVSFLNGTSNASSGVIVEGNSKLLAGVGITAGQFVAGFSRSFRQNIIRQVSATYSASSTAAGTVTITPASMEAIHIGTRLTLINADGTNYEDTIVTATTGTTFTAVLASTKAVNFQIYGSTPLDQEEGSWTPTLYGLTTAGVHTYSTQKGTYQRRGNWVHLRGSITISAKDAAMAGGLAIGGLPFASENVSGMESTCSLAAFSGFTFGAGYTNVSGSLQPNTNFIPLLRFGSAVAYTPVQAGDIPGATCVLAFDIEYSTSSI